LVKATFLAQKDASERISAMLVYMQGTGH